ncbi:S-layer-related duplication domain protein, partial [groundwater metagenome]
MVIKNCIKGIVFAVLMLSVISAAEGITIHTWTPTNESITNVSGDVGRFFEIQTDVPANVTWYINGTKITTGEVQGEVNVTISNYTNLSAASGFWEVKAVARNTSNASDAEERLWRWTVTNAADTTPPASVTDLTVSGKGATWINWSWKNPGDSDFNHTVIKITNISGTIFQGNRTNTTTHFNTTEFSLLSPGSSYTILIQTVDASGNINQTPRTDTQHTLNTPVDSWVSVDLPHEATINFSTVTSEGNTSAVITANPISESKLKRVSDILNITTTAITSGSITVGIKFNLTLIPPGYTTSEVDLYHWNSSSSLWENITSSRDSDRVYGVISSPLSSIFMAGINDTTPPSDITGLSNISGYTWIHWTWANPVGDFDHTEVYLNSSFVMNTSNNYYNTSRNFTLGYKTTHNISLRPVDTSGNIGNWTNGTANTTTPPPRITRISPPNESIESIGIETTTFIIKLEDQIANITWKIGDSVWRNASVLPSALINLTYTPPAKGIYNVSVNACNENGTSDTIYWNWTVHPRTYKTGNRIWDGSKGMGPTYTWDAYSFSGFYYNLKDDLGTEEITISNINDRSIAKGEIQYTTSPREVSFEHKDFGRYEVIGFMADKYFAGYKNTTPPKATESVGTKSALSSGQLHKVLIDDDTKRTVSEGG